MRGMNIIANIVAVGVFGFIGGGLRFLLDSWLPTPSGLPLSTLVINLVGCLALGWFHEFSRTRGWSDWLCSGITVGLIGAFTTFSSFTLDVVQLASAHSMLAAVYVAGSVVGGIALVFLGERAVHWNVRQTPAAYPPPPKLTEKPVGERMESQQTKEVFP
jgi:CrcB protein